MMFLTGVLVIQVKQECIFTAKRLINVLEKQ